MLVASCIVPAALFIQGAHRNLQPASQPENLQDDQSRQERSIAIAAKSNRRPELIPTSAYRRELILGFTVLISPTVLRNPQAARAMRQELHSQLAAIARVVPAIPLSRLRQVKIWVEWANQDGAAEYHPSADWLRQNGYNPDKAGGVEVANIRNFVQWSRTDQPWIMMHELAHAYHHQVLGYTNVGIQSAYQQALRGGRYQSVDYVRGGRQRAYALNNEKEYFAELSEAYFGRNDFYPFTRVELVAFDPVGYQLMQRVWR